MIDHYSSWIDQPMVSIDVETTGLDHKTHRVVELGLVRVEGGKVVEKWSSLLNPERTIPDEVSKIHGIFNKDVEDKPKFVHVVESIIRMTRGAIPVAFNSAFDQKFVWAEGYRCGLFDTLSHVHTLDPKFPWIDPFIWARHFHGLYGRGENTLGSACARWGVVNLNAHRAGDDAEAAVDLLLKMSSKIGTDQTFSQLIMRQRQANEAYSQRGARR